jgi:hypothetical protein
VKINDDIGKRFQATDRLLESMNGKMDNFIVAMQNQLSFNKMLETQIQPISGALPNQSNGLSSRDSIQRSTSKPKSITTIFEGQAPGSSKKSLGSDKGNSKVNGQENVLPMSEVSSDAILNRLRNKLGGPEVPSIHCIIGPLKVHYALCDWGASVNIMPKMVYDCLDEDPLVPIFIVYRGTTLWTGQGCIDRGTRFINSI